jgi:hypothetical protein
MAKISFCFQGFVNQADVKIAYKIAEGKDINVENLTSEELVKELKNGKYAISLTEALKESDAEIEIFDYDTCE